MVMASTHATFSTWHTWCFAHFISFNLPNAPVEAGTVPVLQMREETQRS